MTARLSFVRQETGHGDPGLIREQLPQQGELLVQGGQGILAELRGRLCQPGRLRDLPLEARQRREGQELSCPWTRAGAGL